MVIRRTGPWIAAGAVLGAAAAAAGFLVRPPAGPGPGGRLPACDEPGTPPIDPFGELSDAGPAGGAALPSGYGQVRLREGLPDVLRQHLDPDGDGLVPSMDTAALWGRARLRRGRGPWLWARMTNLHRLGESAVDDLEVTWYGRPTLRVVDASVRGRGLSRVGTRDLVGPEIDQAANMFLWSQAVLVPATFAAGSQVGTFEEPDAVRLTLPAHPGTDTAWLHFDADGRPERFSARRYRGPGEPKLWWHVDYIGWGDEHGIPLPHRVEVTWEDEDRPWLVFHLDGFAADVPVDARVREVDRITAEARRDGWWE